MNFGVILVILGGLLCILMLVVVFNSLRLRKSKPTSGTAPRAPTKRSLKCCDQNKPSMNVFGRR